MENMSYIALSQQMALHRLMDVTANNMANMNTPGFKSQSILFKEYLNKTDSPEEGKISQVEDYGTYRDLSAGALTQTFNKLDAAIQGEGYFAVQTPDGSIRYTKDGSFSLNEKRELVTKSGDKVMSNSNNPITIQSDATDISIMENGEVGTEKGVIGKLKIVSFENEQNLTPVGNNLLDAGSTPEKTVDKPHVMQGMLEGSNVQPLLEMNKMIEILRLYQSAQNMLMNDHDMQRSMIQKLTQV